MSRATNLHPITLFTLLLFCLVTFFSLVACSPNQRTAVVNAAAAISNEVDSSLEIPSELVFSGQVESVDGEWQNGYIVILFDKNGEEVTRTTSRLMNSTFSNNGPMDGVFELRIANQYQFNMAHEFYFSDRRHVSMVLVPGLVGTRAIGTWFDNLHPQDMVVVAAPEKQAEYTLVILNYTQETLPDSHQPGNLTLDGSILVINDTSDSVVDENEIVETPSVSESIQTSQSSVQFTVLPKDAGSKAWNLRMTGYSGNRWDVWEKYVAGYIPGLSWETFEYSVLVHNPHLETDGFVFYPDKTYLLPTN